MSRLGGAVASLMRQISDEYWDVGQATAHPAVAPPVRPVSNYQGVQITGVWLDEQSDRVARALDATANIQTSWHSENPFE